MLRGRALGPAASPGWLLHAQAHAGPSRGPLFESDPYTTDSVTTASSPCGRLLQAVDANSGDGGDVEQEEELVWYDRTLVWSRGSEVFRRYTYEAEGEDVSHAVFAWYKVGSGEAAGPLGKGKSSTNGATASGVETFGPFHQTQFRQWGGPQQASSSAVGPARLERTLVVFLQSRAYVYYSSGECVTVHLPFVVNAAWPLSFGGLMIERALEKRELRRLGKEKRKSTGSLLRGMDQTSMSILDDLMDLDDDNAPSLPRLFVLENPFEELKMVVEGQVEGGYRGDSGRLNSQGEPIGASTTILFLAPKPYPFVVAYDRQSGNIIFYRHTAVPDAPDPPIPPLKPHMLRPEEVLLPPAPSAPASAVPARTGRPSLHRNTSSFGPTTTTDRRLSSAADPLDRSHRRAPRHSRALAQEIPIPTDGLQAALDPTPLVESAATAAKRRSRGVSILSQAVGAAAADPSRRVSAAASSLLAHEGLEPAGPSALHAIAERDLRETTMLMGLERDDLGSRSELVLERIHSWRPKHAVQLADIRVFLTDDLDPARANINVLVARPGNASQLHAFQCSLRSTPSVHYVVTPLPVIECLSAIPVIATRLGIRDTLVLLRSGATQLVTSGGRTMPFLIPLAGAEGHDDVTRQLATGLRMAGNDALNRHQNPDKKLVELVDAVGPRFTAIYEDGERLRFSADLRIKHKLTSQCLKALSMVLPTEDFFHIKREVLTAVQQLPCSRKADPVAIWVAFASVIQRMLHLASPGVKSDPSNTPLSDTVASSDPLTRRLAERLRKAKGGTNSVAAARDAGLQYGETIRPDHAGPIMLALHLVAQDLRLSSVARKELGGLVVLITGIATRIGRDDWRDYWARHMPHHTSDRAAVTQDISYDTSLLDRFDTPPDILAYLNRRLTLPTKPFPSPEGLMPPGHTPEMGTSSSCKQTNLILAIYDRLGPSSSVSMATAVPRATAAVRYMVDSNLDDEWLADLPHGIALPILEAMRVGQHHASKDWTPKMYALVGRMDLALQSQCREMERDEPPSNLLEFTPTIKDLMSSTQDEGDAHRAHQIALPHVRFGSDRRVQEVERIMQTSKLRNISVQDPKGASDTDIARYHQTVVNTIASRTLSIPIGQGMFEYGTRSANITDTWDIPLIELSVKIAPANTTLKAEIVSDSAEWPCFHNGVAAALSISPDCKGLDSSWIVFNRPRVLNAEHGGFLLGLGLTGHLRSLVTYHAFPLMEPRHDFTSVGLLVGLACSYAGSEDLLLTKVLSLHTHALLPLGSMELNASPIIQSSAMVGLGLIYAGSRNLRMAEVSLGEIGRREMPNVEGFQDHQEAYSFSSAMAFGLIMLGRGGATTSEVDRRMLGQMRRYILGDSPAVNGSKGRAASTDVDSNLTGPGATLALGLMYLKTGRGDIADMLEIPQSAFDLDQVRPDLLLLRTMARGLIMWDEITPTIGWIEDQLPAFIRSANTKQGKRTSDLELATELAYLNIVSGACFAIGLKYAGTATELAHSNLMSFFGVLSKAATGSSMTYEGRIRRTAARQGLNVVTLALAMVMSGTGELSVLRRLRVSHGQEGAGVTYGSHMAMHMALGMLFLGRGHYTLGTSNLAIASMCIAFFPRFLASPSDNKAYPQAFRHLWALAVEPRCLVAKDVDTLETVYLPVKLRVQEGVASVPGSKGINGGGPDSAGPAPAPTSTVKIRQQSLISPTLVAPFENILSVEVDSPRYWPITYDLSNPRDRRSLVRTRTIYVKRKAGFLDYNSDPKGNRSIFVRAGSMTGIDLHYDLIAPAIPPGVGPEEVQGLVKVHSGRSDLVAMSRLFNGNGSMDGFVRTVTLECLSLDKPLMISTYLGMYDGLRRSAMSSQSQHPLTLEEMDLLAFTRTFYSDVYDKTLASAPSSSSAEKRFALVRPSFVSALLRALPTRVSEPPVETVKRYLLGQHSDASTSKRDVAGGPADLHEAVALAHYIGDNRLPPLPLLDLLRDKVRLSAIDRQVLMLKVWEVAEAYRTRSVQAYDVGVMEAKVEPMGMGYAAGAWKWDNVREVIRLWTQ
ncbi:hypothetical protein IAU60_004640 [Kwoniella sp. DSM 27419]